MPMEAKRESRNTTDTSEALKLKTAHSEKISKVNPIPGRSEDDTQIAKKKAQRLKVPFVDPLRVTIEPSALSLLGPEMAVRRQAIPIRVVDNFLLVAMLIPE